MKRENKRALHQINFVDYSLLLKFNVTINKPLRLKNKKAISCKNFHHPTSIFQPKFFH